MDPLTYKKKNKEGMKVRGTYAGEGKIPGRLEGEVRSVYDQDIYV